MKRILTLSLIIIFLLYSCKFKDNVTSSESEGTTITVVSPNGGETISDGSSYQIKWTGTGSQMVRIQYSVDNGLNWSILKDSLSNVGTYTWQPVPNIISNQCKIRVSNIDGTSSDDSDHNFSITRSASKSLKVTSPKGGEKWEGGTSQQITWYSSGIDSVYINYTTDNGQHWLDVGTDKKNTGIYYWSPVPNTPTTLAKVRIKDAKDGAVSSESDSTFQILPERTIIVVSPNGGEKLYVGASDSIHWQSSGISNVKIEYTTNGGGSWTTIVSSTPSTGEYIWSPIPNVNSLLCQVRVSDTENNGLTSDKSDANFSISQPGTKMLRVTSPNGGEAWPAGSSQTIKWDATGITNVKIEYTVNNGISWNTITTSTPSTGFYTWTQVPNLPSTNCLVRISDAQSGSPSDISDNFFSITPAPSIAVTLPNGGEIWASGSQQLITYTSQNVANVKIEFTTDGGATWTALENSTPSVGSYTWNNLPNLVSYQCKVRVSDALFGNPSDVSDNNFTITNQAAQQQSIKITSPNGEEEWYAGTSNTIKWQSANVANVKIEFSTNAGANWSTIIAGIANTGAYNWNPVPNVSSLQCLVKVSSVDNLSASDVSDKNFTITSPGTQLIKVTSPAGGEQWAVGSTQNITWSASGISNVKIEYTTNNGINWNTITSSTPSSGFYAWSQLPNYPSTNCKVKISDAEDGSPSDASANFFTITPAPSITVLSPNGGETLLKGSTKTIQYTSQYVPNIKVEYTTDGGATWTTIENSIPASGTVNWQIPDLNSSQCRVRVSDALYGTPSDISDNNFTITNVVNKSVTVTNPNGGEDWEAGTKHNITWVSTAINKMKIELTTDKGSTWATLADSVSGGAYEWSVGENYNSTQCQIRCSDASDSQVSDVSDASFTISPRKWLTVTGPPTRVYKSNEPVTITWQSGGIQYVGIKYTTTNGVADAYNPAFTILADKVGATSGSFTTYFSKPSDKYFVVVYNADEGSGGTPSNNSPGFTIETAYAATISIIQPNGGEQWLASPQNVPVTDVDHYHPFEIKWNATNLSKVKIEWTTNGGGNWYVVPGADSTENDGIFVWAPGRLDSVRPDSSDNCKIKISSVGGGVPVDDLTDGFFSIHESKKIRVTYPNEGQYFWKEPTDTTASEHWPMLISWTSYAVANVNIYYSLDNGVTWTTLATNYQSTGAYGWDFALGPLADYRTSSLGRIKIQDASDNTIWDVNDIPFWLNVKKTSGAVVSPPTKFNKAVQKRK